MLYFIFSRISEWVRSHLFWST